MQELKEKLQQLSAPQKELFLERHVIFTQKFEETCTQQLINTNPDLDDSFSLISGLENQSKFLFKMIDRGYQAIHDNNYQQLYKLFLRHDKYGIFTGHFASIFGIISKNVHDIKSLSEGLPKLFDFLNKQLIIIMEQATRDRELIALEKKRLKKKMAKNSTVILPENIDIVLKTWDEINFDVRSKKKFCLLLVEHIKRHGTMLMEFKELGIDVNKQAKSILQMLNRCLQQLNTMDKLMPYLNELSAKHSKMGVNPTSIADLKNIILRVVSEILTFQWFDETKTSWIKCMNFMVRVMLKDTKSGKGSICSIATSDDLSMSAYCADDIDIVMECLDGKCIDLVKDSWESMDNIVDKLVQCVVNELIGKFGDIRNLFSAAKINSHLTIIAKSIGSSINLLDDKEILIDTLTALGKRHVYYKVKPEMFTKFKTIWHKTLKKALKSRWNKDLAKAWLFAMDFILYWIKNALSDEYLLYVPEDATPVNFKCTINHIDRMSVKEASFFADLTYGVYTGLNSCETYAFKEIDSGFVKYDETPVPPFQSIKCLNAMEVKDSFEQNNEQRIAYFKEDNTYYLRGNISGTFTQNFNFSDYPFDTHNIDFIFMLKTDDSITKFNKNKLDIHLLKWKIDSMLGNDFNIHKPVIKLDTFESDKQDDKIYTNCIVQIPISRLYGKSIIDVTLPLFIIECLSFSIYFAELVIMVERLIVSITLLLTMFAFKWSIGEQLPHHFTFIDWMFNVSYIFAAVHVLALCIEKTMDDDNPTSVSQYNSIAGVVIFILFIIVHVGLLIKAIRLVHKYPKTEIVNNPTTTNHHLHDDEDDDTVNINDDYNNVSDDEVQNDTDHEI